MISLALINRQTKVAIDRAFLVDLAEMITVVSCDVTPETGFSLPDPGGWDVGFLARVVDSESEIQPGDRVMDFLDASEAPSGALADHDMVNGMPAMHCYPGLEDNIADLSVSASHEAFEALGDGDCNRAIVGRDGVVRCSETCDPVEATSFDYTAKSGRVLRCSNYVTPRYFTGDSGRLDRLGQVLYSGAILPGGYQIVFANGQWSQVTEGALRPYRQRLNDLGLGRLARRQRLQPNGPA